MPLWFQFHSRPDQSRRCDLLHCTISMDTPLKIFEGCLHSFHLSCLDVVDVCPICRQGIEDVAQQLNFPFLIFTLAFEHPFGLPLSIFWQSFCPFDLVALNKLCPVTRSCVCLLRIWLIFNANVMQARIKNSLLLRNNT